MAHSNRIIEGIAGLIAQNIIGTAHYDDDPETYITETIERCNEEGWEPRLAAGLGSVSLARYYLDADELARARALAEKWTPN